MGDHLECLSGSCDECEAAEQRTLSPPTKSKDFFFLHTGAMNAVPGKILYRAALLFFPSLTVGWGLSFIIKGHQVITVRQHGVQDDPG